MDRLEMDERTMIGPHPLPLLLALTLGFVGGLVLGGLFFHALRVTAALIVGGGSPLLGLALTMARFSLLGGALYLVALSGGPTLIAALAGVLCSKRLILLHAKGIDP
jgi:hypothetical protein